MSGSPPAELSVLLVESARETVESIAGYAERNTEMEMLPVSSGAEARRLLGARAIDCLVVNPDALATDADGFVAGAECPVVVLTDRDPGSLDQGTVSTVATIVEKGEDTDDWGFLFEKIRGVVRSTGTEQSDYGMYRTLVETARDGLYRTDASGRITYLNESFAEILGYDRQELIGAHASLAMAEGELERGQQVVGEVLASDERESEIVDMEMETKSGERITVSVHFVVLTDENGDYDGLIGVMRDITDRKQRERELRRQNDRLAEFAGIVSHDLRNPLNVAKGHLDLASEECDSEHVETVAGALDRMETLIGETLELARQGETVTETEPLRLSELVDGCWEMVATGEATLERRDDATVYGDRERVKQLFENLFRNAIEHAGENVTITVELLEDGDGFSVADDGPGIPDDERDAVFEPGHTTSDEGTGFGLSIVNRIVDAHGWAIRVTDGESGGARFEVTGVEFADR
jgi:PAS domain S-box-containing protein